MSAPSTAQIISQQNELLSALKERVDEGDALLSQQVEAIKGIRATLVRNRPLRDPMIQHINALLDEQTELMVAQTNILLDLLHHLRVAMGLEQPTERDSLQ